MFTPASHFIRNVKFGGLKAGKSDSFLTADIPMRNDALELALVIFERHRAMPLAKL